MRKQTQKRVIHDRASRIMSYVSGLLRMSVRTGDTMRRIVRGGGGSIHPDDRILLPFEKGQGGRIACSGERRSE